MSPSVLSSAIAVSLALAPPAGSSSPDRVGIAWHDQATVDASGQQRLRVLVSDLFGVEDGALVEDAVLEAQRREAYELPASAAREISDLDARMELAAAQFRAGDLAAAAAQLDVLLERLEISPGLPGAANLARDALVLRGRIAWTQSDADAQSTAWQAALALDPHARLSTREAPPDVVAAFEELQAAVHASRSGWMTPQFSGAPVGAAQIEIDGVLGLRPVPPGRHFVVVRWPGAPAQAHLVPTSDTVDLAEPDISIPAGVPMQRADAEAVCARLELDVLVLARERGARVGAQMYRCGEGFGQPWFSTAAASDATAWADAASDEGWLRSVEPRGVLLDPEPWPMPAPPPIEVAIGPVEDGALDTGPADKPWFRKAWVWVLVGAVVAGGVTTGVVLGTREPQNAVVVTDDFLRP